MFFMIRSCVFIKEYDREIEIELEDECTEVLTLYPAVVLGNFRSPWWKANAKTLGHMQL